MPARRRNISTLGISLLGAGRMGREILQAMATDADAYRLTGVWVRGGPESLSPDDLAAMAGPLADGVVPSADLAGVIDAADVAIDFTLPAANRQIVTAAVAAGKPLVCGVSGLADADLQALRAAGASIPVFFARNMSIGIALLTRCIQQAASVLGADFEVEIHDLHHAQKLDAPSGTALLLGEALAAARGQAFTDVMHYAADGAERPVKQGDIAFQVRREGSYPGRHSVRFANGAEALTFEHDVTDRRVFADGALRAADWLRGQPPGIYGMQDMLASN